MPVKSALAALVASVAAQSEALVVWLLLLAPFFAALPLVGEWNTHFELFLSRVQLHRPHFFESFWRCLQRIHFIFFFLEAMNSMAFFLISSAASLSSDFFFSLAEKLSSSSHNSSMSASFSDNTQSIPLD